MVWNLYQIGQNIERSPTKNRNDVFKKIFECMCDKIPLISRLPESEGQTFEGKRKKKRPPLSMNMQLSERRSVFTFVLFFVWIMQLADRKTFIFELCSSYI